MNHLELHFNLKMPSGMRWSPDGRSLAYQTSGPTGSDLRLYSLETSTDRLVFGDIPPFRLYRELPQIRWLPGGQQLLVKTGRGYHRVDGSGKEEAAPAFSLPEDAELAQLSPDLQLVSFLREGDLWVQPLPQGEPHRLTTGEGLLTADGQLFGRLQQWPQWSPDSSRLAYVSPTQQGALVRIVDLAGAVTDVLPAEDRWALNTLTWAPDSRRLAIARLSNDYCRKALSVYSLADHKEFLLWEDKDDKWVDHSIHAGFDVAWSHDGRKLAFLSNRSGWRHLYVASIDDGRIQQITSGNYETYWCGWSPDDSLLAYVNSQENLQSRSLWVVNADGSDPRALVTEGLVTGGWYLRQVNLEWSPNGRQIAFVQSGSRQVPELKIVDVLSPRQVRSAFSSLPEGVGEDFAMSIEPVHFPAADGLDLRAALLTAPTLDRTRQNPALVFAYGAWDMEAQLGWDFGPKNLLFNYLTQSGYVVLIVDPRGSEGYGDAYSKGQYREGGRKQSDDLVAGASFLAGLGWVDPRKIALFGYSYGGYMVLQTMQRSPGVFAAGISMAPVTEWNAYAAGSPYANLRFGTPDMVPNPLLLASPLYSANHLEGDLLILHGTKDFNVPIVFSEMYVTALMKLGKSFAYMAYPNEAHVWTRPETIRDFMSRMLHFLDHNRPNAQHDFLDNPLLTLTTGTI
jgi:dipeptidyl aminopeptidase/acylaminoacyl peptidase